MTLGVARNWKAWTLPLAGLAYWLAGVHVLSPQWSVYPQYGYGWAVPVLCLFLWWQRWKTRPEPEIAAPAPALWIALLLLLTWLPTRFVVEANSIWRMGSWALGGLFISFALALLQLAGGSAWRRHFWFPLAFYLVAIPWPSQWEHKVIQSFTGADTAIVTESLGWFGIPAIQHGNVIETSRGLVGVDEACSGIRSLQATLMIALFLGEWFCLTRARRVALVICGACLAFLCNVVRTFVLVWISSHQGNAAMQKWHDPTGVAILLTCFTGLWLVATTMPARKAAANPPTMGPGLPINRPFAWAGIVLIWLIGVECVVAYWFGIHDPMSPEVMRWTVQWPNDSDQFRELPISGEVRYELGFDAGQSATWNDSQGHPWQAFHFRWGPAKTSFDRMRVQFARTHRPEVCLPAAGVQLEVDRGARSFPVRDLSLAFERFRFRDKGIPLHVFFCNWEDGRPDGATAAPKTIGSRLENAWRGRRSSNHRVLELAVWGSRTDEEADAGLQRLLGQLVIPTQ